MAIKYETSKFQIQLKFEIQFQNTDSNPKFKIVAQS